MGDWPHEGDWPALALDWPLSPELRRAHAAAVKGCRFLIERVAEYRVAPMPHHEARGIALRRGGNCLRELDRLLSLLLDACAQREGLSASALARFERSQDTAFKLRRIVRHGSIGQTATLRLRAIARLRARACGDRRTGPVSPTARDLALATAGRSGICAGQSAPLALTDEVLGQIAQFYLDLIESVMASA